MQNQQDQFKIDELGKEDRRKKVSFLHEQGTRGGLYLISGQGLRCQLRYTSMYTHTEHCGGLCSVSR